MSIKERLEELLYKEIETDLAQFKGKLFLLNKEVAPILRIEEEALKKRIETGMYKELYEPKRGKEKTIWNKFKFFKWYIDEQVRQINAA